MSIINSKLCQFIAPTIVYLVHTFTSNIYSLVPFILGTNDPQLSKQEPAFTSESATPSWICSSQVSLHLTIMNNNN